MATATTTRPSPTVSKTTLQPLDDHLLVRPNDPERSTASGLVIPDTATEKPDQGTVLAVGPGRRSDHTGDRLPLDIAVGNTVVFAKFGGTEIRIDGEDLLILSAKQVLATITENGQK
ncbi:MAG: chaperonin GroES [Ilumatobacter sp.]|jgi:chaperonin GroES|tara:strand:+ start:3182 stop:3532 length:351 start_codon:yes stop_codon:yes gene_type:complete